MVAKARIERQRDSERSKLGFVCSYCQKSFAKERTLLHHLCEQGRRAKQKNLKHVQIGFQAYLRFYQLAQGLASTKTYEDFCESAYYLAFIKFGQYIIDVNCLKPEEYIDWVIRSGKPLDKWATDTIYAQYLQDFLLKEDYMDAVQRTLNVMADWADENKSVFNHYFKYATTNKIIYDVLRAKISPWLIYCSKSGKEWIETLTEEELNILMPWISPDKWAKKIREHPSQQREIQNLLDKAEM